MYVYLKRHPDIFMSKLKELHCFGSDLKFKRPRQVTMKNYLSFFSDAKNEKRVGEASVMYLYSKRAGAEIKNFNPSARIIIMLRNPIDMMYAFHNHLVTTADEDIEDFKTALNTEEERKHGRKIPKKTTIVDFLFYRELAKYTPQVRRYFDLFGRDNVYVIIYDDFKSNTSEVYKKNFKFLDVDPNFRTDFKVINPSKFIRKKYLLNFLKSPPEIIRKPIKTSLPLHVRRHLIRRIRKLIAQYKPRPPMSSDLKSKLQKEFQTEVEHLSQLLRHDLSFWFESNT